MKLIAIAFILMFILSVSTVIADERAKYSFGHMQAEEKLLASPGEVIDTVIYFYNIYGNRITHISLNVMDSPENWIVQIDPPLHEAQYNISDKIATIEENLYVEPSEAAESIPDTIPEDIEYINSKVGYIGANFVNVKIYVPDDAELGKSYNLTISTLAEWLGQSGTAEVRQGWDFHYTVNIESGREFFEEPVEPGTGAEPQPELYGMPESGNEPEGDFTGYIAANAGYIGLIIILIILLVYFGFVRKK